MKHHYRTFLSYSKQAGQSLVETALFLPLLITILAGVVEVSNVLVTHNRVTSAARSATGFAASNISIESYVASTPGMNTPQWANSMQIVGRNTVTDTLFHDLDRWDIWTIKAKLNATGDAYDGSPLIVHAYGDNSVVSAGEWSGRETEIKNEILTQLQADGNDASELEFVATVAYYHSESILGLDAMEGLAGLTEVRGLSVMRVDGPADAQPCNLFPITIDSDNISLYPSDYNGQMVAGGSLFPGGYVPNNPIYTEADSSAFPDNVPGVHLSQAKRGYIYEARENAGVGSFGWLDWNSHSDQGDLVASLKWPGNLMAHPNPPHPFVRYENPGTPANGWTMILNDLVPNVGDWVNVKTGNVNSNAVNDALTNPTYGHISMNRTIPIIVFSDHQNNGSNAVYEIGAFAFVRIKGYNFGGNSKSILIEFVDWAQDLCIDPNG